MTGQSPKSGKSDKLDKRAAALRENLKKRKAQQQARTGKNDEDDRQNG